MTDEHPLSRKHRCEFDDGLIAVLTEVCAFSWADSRGLGPLCFTSSMPGVPDIQGKNGLWIEAKSILPSAQDRRLTKMMLESGAFICGDVEMPGDGLWNKLEYVLADTKKKLARQTRQEGVLFLHIVSLDTASRPAH
ncbi:MAG: hypothetical protein AB7P40_31785, partial [Chloroflexota bacterium]